MRVGILSQWYDPEPGPAALPGVLARELVARGHEVQVLTGFPNYPTGRIADGYRLERRLDEQADGVHVRRVALYPSHSASPVARALNYASFGASAVASGVAAFDGLDAIWVNYSPITVAWPMWVARLRYRVPVVLHVLDLWPDTLLATGFDRGTPAAGAVRTGLDAWCRRMYRTADAVAYISPGVGAVLQERGVPRTKLHYAPMWADEEVFHPSTDDMRSELGLAEQDIVLLYAGTLGEAQGLSTLLEACAQVTDPRFVCLMAGSGIGESRLREHAARVGAHNVRFLGRLPQEAMTRLMATGDLNYVGLSPHPLSRVTMPSKTQSGLAVGRALLVAAEGDVATVVRDNDLGFVADPADSRDIAAAIQRACTLGRPGLSAMGSRARTYYLDTFSVAHGVGRVEALLHQASESRRSAA